MGIDLITTGYTAIHETAGTPALPREYQELTALFEERIKPFEQQLFEKLELIDASGFIDYAVEDMAGELPEDTPEDEITKAALFRAVVKGAVATELEWRMSATYGFEGKDGSARYFIILGGGSGGDAPIDDFDEICMFINAATEIPELGKAFGILGGGIVTT